MDEKNASQFFENLASYYRHENDLSNITVALCNASECFKEKFLHFFFDSIDVSNVTDITREVWDQNGAGSRVDIHISMNSDEKYIIEVKIGDKNHHFGQYEDAFGVDIDHFGYITNYYCREGLKLGYDVKTWRQFYDTLNRSDNLDSLSHSYMSYLKKVCGITKYNSPMNLKSLNAIPQFFETMDSIVAKESETLHISPLDEKRGAWNYSYKVFRIDGKVGNEWLTNGYFLVYYPGPHTISIGIAGCDKIPVKDIEKNAKNEQFSYSNVPYIDTDWWGYLWYDLSDSALEQMQKTESMEEQEKILTNYLNEVMSSIRKHEKG